MFDDIEEWAINTQRNEVVAGHWWLLSQPQQVAEQAALFVLQQDE